MGKRGNHHADDPAAFRKRQKVTHEVPAGEDVLSSDQLRKLLTFDQDLHRARHGLSSFKRLLDDIVANQDDRNAKINLLQEYLEAVKPRQISEDAVHLSDIMEMWSFAVQVNNDGVMSSAVVVLALLLHVISDSLRLVPYGLDICRTLLQERQLKSLSKNLSSEKGKGFVLSPTLRLLKEIVSLDGGAFAKQVFRARSYTFAYLGRNLEVGNTGEGPEDAKKASVRTNAVKFFLACLKFLHSDGRKELLTQKELFSHLTFMIKTDAPWLVLEILDALKTCVLMDDKIPRDVKFKSFNTKTLTRVLGLYTYGTSANTDEEKASVADKAHEFLLYVCTTPEAGILYSSTGLYPKPESDELVGGRRRGKFAGVESGLADHSFSKGIPVFNFVLSEFAQKLRPWSSLKHSELLVSMFSVAPELLADYFFTNRSFTFEPKLTMTWIGYATFLFSTMQLPLPSSFGDRSQFAHTPPPTTILLDNIIPLPINQKVLVRCLSPKSNLTSFFATRLLVTALEKLATAIKMHETATDSKDRAVWEAASRRLIDAFCQRIPDMKEIVRSYKTIPVENYLHRTLATRLIRLYYEVIPRVALAANFDVSPFFVDVLRSLDDEASDAEARSFGVMQLENLVSIASFSPGMRWFSKIDNISNGASSLPFTALLRLLCVDSEDSPSRQINKVLTTVAVENQLVLSTTGIASLLQALRAYKSKDSKGMVSVWSYLDNCINRCASSPIKYLEMLQLLVEETKISDDDPRCPLLMVTLVEQLQYLSSSVDDSGTKAVAKFLSLYFNAESLGTKISALVDDQYGKVKEYFSSKSVTLKKLGSSSDITALQAFEPETAEEDSIPLSKEKDEATVDAGSLKERLHVVIDEDPDTNVITRWATKEVEDLIEDSVAARLVRLLASPHVNIRKEASTNILKMASKIKESSYEEKDQVWLLLCEVAESSKPHIDAGPAPSAFVAFATHSLDVLQNPLHPLYPKVNTFLTRGPVWSAEKLPLAHDILHGEPSEDDRYYTEVTWLLAYLLDALVTPFDLSVFHKKRWFEKILSLGSNPYLRVNLRTRILRIIYRATCIESGSTTLVTRFGIISWLDSQRALCESSEEASVIRALMRRIWDTCDQKKVEAWSRGGVQKLIENVCKI
ncbi:unnamed protein product [Clonostachys rhizophaga]|uniref:Ribosome biogenesis protein Urb1 n=1 Tax=Clonostachys rhizophaga TaxID=160324 RepID=A0A9N9VB48_9HYPO|nr:unnamed protein product [Clonostachys rhizophaga]